MGLVYFYMFTHLCSLILYGKSIGKYTKSSHGSYMGHGDLFFQHGESM